MASRSAAPLHRFPALLPTLTLLLLSPALASGLEVEPTQRHSLRSGAWALEFSFSGFSGIPGVSVKHHLSDRIALRLGGTVSIDERESDGSTREVFPSFPMVDYDATRDSDSRDYTAFLHLQPYLYVQERTAIYVYGGPVAGWSRSTEYERQTLTNGASIRYDRDYEAWSAGLELGAGFEWFWTRRVSLGAYYGVTGQYGDFDRDERYFSSQYDPPAILERADHGQSFSVRTRASLLKIEAHF